MFARTDLGFRRVLKGEGGDQVSGVSRTRSLPPAMDRVVLDMVKTFL